MGETRSKAEDESATKGGERSKKVKFAEYVTLTPEEYISLVERLGSEEKANRAVEILDNYKGATGKRYRSDYRAILNWVIRRLEEEELRQARDSPHVPRAFAGLMELAKGGDGGDAEGGC